jgi:hypothetical protein
MTPQTVVGLLAEPARMRVFAAVVLGATTVAEVAQRTDLPVRTVATALQRLDRGGLVTSIEGALSVRSDAFAEAARTLPSPDRGPLPDDADPARSAVLRAFLVDGHLVAIPAVRGKRRVILEHLAAAFEPGVRYPEREVVAVLRAWHPDHAALRRYLVDEELLARDRGVYWRVGGPTMI